MSDEKIKIGLDVPIIIQKQFAPIIKIHKAEKYKPAGIDFLLQKSVLMSGAPPSQTMIMMNPTQVDLLTHNSRENYLNFLEEAFDGENTVDNSQENPQANSQENSQENQKYAIPMYSHGYRIPNGKKFRSWTSSEEFPLVIVQYFFLFGYNGAKKMFDVCCCERGEHVYDLENLDVLLAFPTVEQDQLNPEKYRPLEVRFGAHRETDGVWKSWDAIEKSGTHPIAYSAIGSHGLYPDIGCTFLPIVSCIPCIPCISIVPCSSTKYGFPRIFCAANDYVDSKGVNWLPMNVQSFDDIDQGWNEFIGGFETYQTGDSPKQHTYYGNSPEFSSNWFLRLCCPCYPC